MIEDYDNNISFQPIYNDALNFPLDLRLYNCDGEDLFEGPLSYYLENIKPIFQRMGLKIDWENEIIEQTHNKRIHKVTVNNKEYFIFKGDIEKERDYWEIGVKNFVEMINDQLKLQRSEDRLYPISCKNDTLVMFLTSKQFRFINHVYKNENWKPMKLKKWCKRYIKKR